MASMRRTIRSWHCWPCLMLVCAACSAQADSLAESKHEAADKLDAPQLVLRGHEKLKTDQDGAISDFTAAIELQPDLARAYEYRGLAKGMKGDLDGAIADLDE